MEWLRIDGERNPTPQRIRRLTAEFRQNHQRNPSSEPHDPSVPPPMARDKVQRLMDEALEDPEVLAWKLMRKDAHPGPYELPEAAAEEYEPFDPDGIQDVRTHVLLRPLKKGKTR